ncbi:MAG: oligosaccharide flippase family protein [Gemmatimonadetes bacterium]|nr:oligosaccharide flippase family protein [Gemmatimonadota bacterium]
MSRTTRLLQGVAFGYANQVLVTLVGIWLTAFLLGRLGQADYGVWLVGTRILGYLLLLDVGVVALLPREVAFATGRAGGLAQATDLPGIIGRTARIVGWQTPLVAIASLLVWLLLPTEWEALRAPLAAVLVVFVLTFPARVFHAALSGLQDLAYLGGTYTATWIVGTGMTVGLVLAGWGLYALAVGWAVSQGLSSAIWWVRLRRRFPTAVPRRRPTFSAEPLRDRLGRGLWISAAQVAQVLLQGTDLLIIGALLGPNAVVPYFCTAKVLTVLANQPQLLAQTAQPALSELRTSADRHRLREVCVALTRAILVLSGGVVCLVLLVNQGFVAWWVGSAQYGGFWLTLALVAGMLLRHWNMTAIYSLFALGHDKRISITTLVDGAVTVVASVLLTRAYGLLGAALGTIVGVVVVGLPANLTLLAQETAASVSRMVMALWPWAWRFALAAATVLAVSRAWVPRTLPALVAATLLGGAGYLGLMWPLALQEPLGQYVRPRLAALRRLAQRMAE